MLEELKMPMLEVKDLVVSYGAIRALKGISFDVKKGEIISLIGANRWVFSGLSFMAIFIRVMTTVITMHVQPKIWKDWKESGPLYRMSLWIPCSWSLTRFFPITVFLPHFNHKKK